MTEAKLVWRSFCGGGMQKINPRLIVINFVQPIAHTLL